MTLQATLPDSTHLGHAHLMVADLARSLRFYQGILGMDLRSSAGGRAELGGAGGKRAVLVLEEGPGATPRPPRTTGLFHIALRYPDRKGLARAVHRLIGHRWPLQGASDHRVSEALYLADPDGLGVELYADRPRESWPRRGEAIAMTTEPLDVEGLLSQAAPDDLSEVALDLGHVHLQVADLAEARAFYHGLLGFAVMQEDYPGALFVAAGGYHHHIGMNIWASRGAPAPPSTAVGLQSFSVQLPDFESLAALKGRLQGGGVTVRDRVGPNGGQGVVCRAPGAVEVELYAGPPS